MQGTASKSLLKSCEGNDGGEQKEIGKKFKEKEVGNQIDEISERFQCINIIKGETSKKDYSDKQTGLLTPLQRSRTRLTRDIPELFGAKHGLWRQEQKSRAAKLQKQLKARRELEALIKEHLNKFHAHYNQATVLSHIEDVSKLLMPQWAAPQELATLSWLGDWRPSAILELLHGLAPFFLSDSTAAMEKVLSQLVQEMRVEEAVIDEEMAEIQSTCVLHLPFGPVKSSKSGGSALRGIQSEFKKIARVITKAHKLRVKALELVVKKVLNQTDAAEFLVAFSGIQDAIHQFAEHKRLRKGPVTLSIKSQDVVGISKQPKINLEDRISLWEKTSVISEQEKSGQEIEAAIHQFEEKQRLRKGPVTLCIKSQDVVETLKQPKIHLEDRISLRKKTRVISEQEKSGQEIEDAIDELEEQPKIKLEERTSLWEKFSALILEDGQVNENSECLCRMRLAFHTFLYL